MRLQGNGTDKTPFRELPGQKCQWCEAVGESRFLWSLSSRLERTRYQ
ncbi:MAG: hypothetical protein IKV57_05150 [Clostridia bacterium]|nr:hypothetical protein [Clostridia bacterium]